MKSRIAYIDDNLSNLECIKVIFSSSFDIDTFISPELFLKSYNSLPSYAAIIIDIHMPVMDGFSLYEKLVEHSSYNGCAVLFISGDDSEMLRVKSLSLGAVDFLSRHMHADEMIARVESKIKFFKKLRSILEFGNMRLNITLIKCFIDSKEVPLTFIEFKLLCQMLINYPEILNKDKIIELVWGSEKVLDATIYTHISNLNGKLADWDHHAEGVKNKGFCISKKEVNA